MTFSLFYFIFFLFFLFFFPSVRNRGRNGMLFCAVLCYHDEMRAAWLIVDGLHDNLMNVMTNDDK